VQSAGQKTNVKVTYSLAPGLCCPGSLGLGPIFGAAGPEITNMHVKIKRLPLPEH
jgi:hypothetical protein